MAHPNERKELLVKAKADLNYIKKLYRRDYIIENACDIIRSKILMELGDIEISELIYDNNKNYRR